MKMDFAYMKNVLPLYEKAAVLTLRIGLEGIIFATFAGIVCAVILYEKVPVLRQLVMVYIEISRNTPLLVQLFFIYYGLPKAGIVLSAEICGAAGLAFLGGSYMAEASGGGLTMRYVVGPQAVATSIPAFLANVIFLLKETSVFSAISLMDLMFTAKDLIGLYYKTTESLLLLVIFYLFILLPVSLTGAVVERRMKYAGSGS